MPGCAGEPEFWQVCYSCPGDQELLDLFKTDDQYASYQDYFRFTRSYIVFELKLAACERSFHRQGVD